MSDMFEAWLVEDAKARPAARLTRLPADFLAEGDLQLRVLASSINYKDGLALTGRAPVVRRVPLIPGIDLVGEVDGPAGGGFSQGDIVIVTGQGLGETANGGLAERALVDGGAAVALPAGLTPADAMAVGTAGFTAMLCVMALEKAGVVPDRGPVLVTGAAGGVGSVAVALLAGLGYRVVASTGRSSEADYLMGLGAAEVIGREAFSGEVKALARTQWAGAVDVVGSATLAHVLSQTMDEGAVAACGLAQGMDLPTSVAPFILRGVSLVGVNSVARQRPRRLEAWSRLARDLDIGRLRAMTTHVGLASALEVGGRILAGEVRGRVVVDIARLTAMAAVMRVRGRD